MWCLRFGAHEDVSNSFRTYIWPFLCLHMKQHRECVVLMHRVKLDPARDRAVAQPPHYAARLAVIFPNAKAQALASQTPKVPEPRLATLRVRLFNRCVVMIMKSELVGHNLLTSLRVKSLCRQTSFGFLTGP